MEQRQSPFKDLSCHTRHTINLMIMTIVLSSVATLYMIINT